MKVKDCMEEAEQTLVGVSGGVDEPGSLAGLPAEESVKIRTCFVLSSALYSVALGAFLNKKLLSLSYITGSISHLQTTSKQLSCISISHHKYTSFYFAIPLQNFMYLVTLHRHIYVRSML